MSRILLAFVLLLVAPAAAAQEGPQPPCGAAPLPAYPSSGAPPNVRIWSRKDLPEDWRAPACAGWPADRYMLVVALAGVAHVEGQGAAEELLARFGAVSATRGIKYWSITDDRWRVLFPDAFALETADLEERRSDFTVAEMMSGEDLYFAQKDNRSTSPVVYRMQVAAAEPERLVVRIENASAVRLGFLTLFEPGDLRSLYVLERLSPEEWGYYDLAAVAERPSLLPGAGPSSFANRAVALYRHVAGIPTDQEPPHAK